MKLLPCRKCGKKPKREALCGATAIFCRGECHFAKVQHDFSDAAYRGWNAMQSTPKRATKKPKKKA